jgi:DNA-binding FadR family transcriptional regulator
MTERTLTQYLALRCECDDQEDDDGPCTMCQARDRITSLESTNARLVGALAEVRQALESSAARLRCEADDEESIGHMNTADDIRAIADTLTRVARIAKKALAHAGGEKPAS